MTCCASEQYLNKEGFLYAVNVIRYFVDKEVDRCIKDGLIDKTITDEDILNSIKRVIDEELTRLENKIATEDLVTEYDLDRKINSLRQDLKQVVKDSVTAEDINGKIASAVSAQVLNGNVLKPSIADTKYVKKDGDVMSGPLTAPSFITKNGIEFF